MATIWQQWVQSGRLNLVPMGQTHTHPLGIFAVGTEELGSCSAVVIASFSRVILSHIPPRTEHEDGDTTARRMMTDVKGYFQSYRGDFDLKTRGVVVCAIFKGALALESQVKIMSSSLTELSLDPQYRPYDVDPKNFGAFPGQGTVLIVQGSNSPVIYVDNKMVPDPDPDQAASRRYP